MNKNKVRQPKRWECDPRDPQVQGANVKVDGVDRHFGMPIVRALQRFNFNLRNAAGVLQRPMAQLSDGELSHLEAFDMKFEESSIPGHYYPLTPFQIGKYYRQGY